MIRCSVYADFLYRAAGNDSLEDSVSDVGFSTYARIQQIVLDDATRLSADIAARTVTKQ